MTRSDLQVYLIALQRIDKFVNENVVPALLKLRWTADRTSSTDRPSLFMPL
jgi:hypothetical protein